MDQDSMVTASLDGGEQLIAALVGHGVEIETAFWTKLSGEEKWLLYLVSKAVDERGPGFAYRLIHSVLRDAPEWGIDPFQVMAIGPTNPMAKAAAEVVKPKPATGQFAVADPKPYPGITRYGGNSLGGVRIDTALIYPPPQAATSAEGTH